MADEATIADSVITDEMRGAIGRVLRQRSSYPISASDIRRWAIAVYYPEPPPAQAPTMSAIPSSSVVSGMPRIEGSPSTRLMSCEWPASGT